jgi:hypothetical protein
MPKKTSDPSSLPDEDNPEWTPETSARARPAARQKKTAKSTKPYAWTPTSWTPTETKAKAGKRSSTKCFAGTCHCDVEALKVAHSSKTSAKGDFG